MKRKALLIFLIPFVLYGCGVIKTNTKQPTTTLPATGVFQSTDGGQSWKLTGDLYITEGSPKKISYSLLYAFLADPSDPKAIYLATDRGIYYTYNRGSGWFTTLSGKGPINDVAVHPVDSCTLYALVRNEVHKSDDCSRNWTRKHFSSLQNEFFVALFISRSNPDTIFVSTSKGTLLQSHNGGESWEVKEYLPSPIKRFVAHPYNKDAFFFVTEKGLLQATYDNGDSWVVLNDLPAHMFDGEPILTKKGGPASLKDLSKTNLFLDLQFDGSQENGLIYSSQYGIFRLIGGDYWQEIEILNKPREQTVYSVAIDTIAGNTVYFATAKGFYRSQTSGKDWTISNLPASGKPEFILVSSDDPNHVLVSFEAWPAKK